jgi:4'-phosphopantetheinyl transferase
VHPPVLTVQTPDTIIPLATDEIHLWLASYDEVVEELQPVYRSILSAEERVQEPRFHFAKDRRRYLVTRALVRTVLSRYVSVPPAAWTFSSNAYGRPEIANGEGRAAGLSFNLSHTHSLIVLGVTRSRALGVDVENFRAREVSLDVARHFFAPDEVEELSTVPSHEQQYRFFEYWTFKESYIKARGMGLSLPLDKFSFRYPHDRGVSIAIDPALGDAAARWQFWQFRPMPEYLVAVCAERTDIDAPRLTVRRTIPMLSERTISPDFLRVTDDAFVEHELSLQEI